MTKNKTRVKRRSIWKAFFVINMRWLRGPIPDHEKGFGNTLFGSFFENTLENSKAGDASNPLSMPVLRYLSVFDPLIAYSNP